jgi:hypothetical protein
MNGRNMLMITKKYNYIHKIRFIYWSFNIYYNISLFTLNTFSLSCRSVSSGFVFYPIKLPVSDKYETCRLRSVFLSRFLVFSLPKFLALNVHLAVLLRDNMRS